MKDINRELANTKISDANIAEINATLTEKFDLFFEQGESTLLKRIATPNIISIFKNLGVVKFAKSGDLCIESLYKMIRVVETNLKKQRSKTLSHY